MPGKERRAIVTQYLEAHALAAWTADGWDDCILGLVDTDTQPRVVYDLTAMLDTLMQRDGMDYQEAAEYLSYDVLGAHPGGPVPAPLYLERVDHL